MPATIQRAPWPCEAEVQLNSAFLGAVDLIILGSSWVNDPSPIWNRCNSWVWYKYIYSYIYRGLYIYKCILCKLYGPLNDSEDMNSESEAVILVRGKGPWTTQRHRSGPWWFLRWQHYHGFNLIQFSSSTYRRFAKGAFGPFNCASEAGFLGPRALEDGERFLGSRGEVVGMTTSDEAVKQLDDYYGILGEPLAVLVGSSFHQRPPLCSSLCPNAGGQLVGFAGVMFMASGGRITRMFMGM